MDVLIDCLDYNSFPNEFIEIVVDKVNSMLANERQELLESNDLLIIDKYFRVLGNNFDWYNKTLIPLMNKYDFACFHSTRVYDKNDILNKGLRINEWEEYASIITNTLEALNVSADKCQIALDFIKAEYERKNLTQPELCFFSGLNLIKQDYAAGYENWCESIGGELASWALEDNMPEMYSLLKNNGEPFYVKFKLRFERFHNHCKASILKELLTKVICEELLHKDYEVQFDGKTLYNISPDAILQLIPCDYKF